MTDPCTEFNLDALILQHVLTRHRVSTANTQQSENAASRPISSRRIEGDLAIPLPFTPKKDWVLIDMEEKKYEGLMVIPESAKDAPIAGIVLAIGPKVDAQDSQSTTEVGERVLFAKYSGVDIEWDGRKYLLVKDDDIICSINKEP